MKEEQENTSPRDTAFNQPKIPKPDDNVGSGGGDTEDETAKRMRRIEELRKRLGK